MKAGILISWLVLCLYSMTGRAQNAFYPDEDLHFSDKVNRLPAQWSVMYNPANTAGIDKTSFGMYCMNLYRIEGLNAAAFGCAIPYATGVFEFSAYEIGFRQMHENRFGLSYAMKINNWFQAGIGLHFNRLSQPAEYTDLYAVLPSLGIRLHPLKNMIAGVSVYNPANQSYRPPGYAALPACLTISAGYGFGQEFFMGIIGTKTTGNPFEYRVSAELIPMKKLYCGIHIHVNRQPGYSVEMGYVSNQVSVIFGFSYQPTGGWSPALNLMYSLR